MADWNVQPSWKKSVIERQHMRKDGNEIIIETGWRWGEFIVTTEDDNPPQIESGVDIYNCDYETELIETFDGCWEEIDMDDVDDETREWLEEFLEENSYFDLEEHGWIMDDCEMIIDCDLVIRKVNEDGSLGEPIEVKTDEEEAAELQAFVDEHNSKLKTQAAWPFENATLNEDEEDNTEPVKWPFERPHEGPKEQ